MKRIWFLAALIVGLAAIPMAEAKTTWRKYSNFRWNYSFDYPSTLVSQPEPENGGGLAFFSPDGQVRLYSYGQYELDGESSIEELQREAEWGWIGSTGRVTYRASKANWFVSSGITDDGRVFYQRLEHRHDPATGIVYDVTFTISYPQSVKSKWNPVTERIAKSFRVRNCPGGC